MFPVWRRRNREGSFLGAPRKDLKVSEQIMKDYESSRYDT